MVALFLAIAQIKIGRATAIKGGNGYQIALLTALAFV
jgi:hypothetical protein